MPIVVNLFLSPPRVLAIANAHEFEVPELIDHHVFRPEVSVDYVFYMQVLRSQQQLAKVELGGALLDFVFSLQVEKVPFLHKLS